MTIPSMQSRLRQYEAAKTRMMNWRDRLQEAYDNTLPDRVNFNNLTIGQTRSTEIFDATPIMATKMFANNIQSILMPPGRNWAVFEPGTLVAEDNPNKQDFQIALQQESRIFFDFLRRSNFDFEVNSSLQDMAISTGVLLINEGTKDNPFIFTAVSIDKVLFDKNEKTGKLERVWRTMKVKAENIHQMWPKAELPSDVTMAVKNNPEAEFEIIEGTTKIPDTEEEYYYYVTLKDSKKDIFVEKRDYNPWIIFRWNVRTDEVLGWGPVMEGMPFIKVLNKIAELELKAANLKAYPPYIGIDSTSWNVNFARIEPNSIIPVGMDFIDKDPLRPVPSNGDPQFAQLMIEKLQASIKELLFADPLPAQTAPRATATEISIRQQNWIRSSGTSINRLMVELLNPMVEKCTKILKKFGLIGDVQLDGKRVQIKYDSPIVLLEGQDQFNRIAEYIQFFGQTFGPSAALGVVNIDQLPGVISNNLGVDQRIVASAEQVAQTMQNINKALGEQANQGQELPQQPQEPTPIGA